MPKIQYKRIKRISPSQFYSMKRCPYKMVLAEALGNLALLPFSPAAYFGTVLHKVIEDIEKGTIRTDEEFDEGFNRQLQIVESKLHNLGFGFFVPLKNVVKDYGTKKLQARKHLGAKISKTNKKYSFTAEKWLSSKDGVVGGRLDLIIECNELVEIVDLKTGAITENSLEEEDDIIVSVKQEYQTQLKMYAQLYFEEYGKYPNALTIVGINKERYSVSFKPSECEAIYIEAKRLLSDTNEGISELQFVANPNEDNCKWCLYRPACSFFHEFMPLMGLINDVSGIVNRVTKFANGNVSVWLQTTGSEIQISALRSDFHDKLVSRVGRVICIYNLRKTGQESSFKATNTTMIYE